MSLLNAPIREPMYDESGAMSRSWVQFFQSLGNDPLVETSEDSALLSLTGFNPNPHMLHRIDQPGWITLSVTPGAASYTSGVSAVSYTPAGGDAVYLHEFPKDAYMTFPIQLPHSYAQNRDIYAHAHWTPGSRGSEEAGAMVGWKLKYSWANKDGVFAALATLDLQDAAASADDTHQMTQEVVISGSGKEIASTLLCTFIRTDTGTDDTWASSTSGQLPLLLSVDFHIPVDMFASRHRNLK